MLGFKKVSIINLNYPFLGCKLKLGYIYLAWRIDNLKLGLGLSVCLSRLCVLFFRIYNK